MSYPHCETQVEGYSIFLFVYLLFCKTFGKLKECLWFERATGQASNYNKNNNRLSFITIFNDQQLMVLFLLYVTNFCFTIIIVNFGLYNISYSTLSSAKYICFNVAWGYRQWRTRLHNALGKRMYYVIEIFIGSEFI